MQGQASVWTLAALGSSGTQCAHTQTGTDLVQQDLTLHFGSIG